jgi:hypothetical protein
MKQTQRIKITITHRRVLRVWPALVGAHCPVCEREVATVTVSEAAAALEVDALTLRTLMAAGTVHTIRTVTDSLRLCQDSLFV